MRLLVTGTGRCGTRWMAEALTAAGAECGHEQAFNAVRHGEVPWTAESSWLAAPYLGGLDRREVYVVHLVRHPLRVIASRAATKTFRLQPRPTRHGRFAIRHAPRIARWRTKTERSAAHYAAWTRMTAAHEPDELLRLEDVTPAAVERLARLVAPEARCPELPPPANGRASVAPLAWERVRHIPGLTRMADRLGYGERP